MIYVDTSVLLATLLSEDRAPPPAFWNEALVSSRLLAVEAWVRVHAKGLGRSHSEPLGALLGRLAFLEMDSRVLGRAMETFPKPVRALDAIHLASALYLRTQGQAIRIATFDERMLQASRALELPLHEISAS